MAKVLCFYMLPASHVMHTAVCQVLYRPAPRREEVRKTEQCPNETHGGKVKLNYNYYLSSCLLFVLQAIILPLVIIEPSIHMHGSALLQLEMM